MIDHLLILLIYVHLITDLHIISLLLLAARMLLPHLFAILAIFVNFDRFALFYVTLLIAV